MNEHAPQRTSSVLRPEPARRPILVLDTSKLTAAERVQLRADGFDVPAKVPYECPVNSEEALCNHTARLQAGMPLREAEALWRKEAFPK